MKLICLLAIISLPGLPHSTSADEPDAAKKAEQRSCTPCHSLRLVESQRLPAATWQKEVDKMIGWGAVVPERQELIDYLAQHYSNTRPPQAPVLSEVSKSAGSN